MRLIYLFVSLPFFAFSQELSFSTAPKNKNIVFNAELKKAIESNNIKTLELYINKNKKTIDDATLLKEYRADNGVFLKKPVPALHDILEQCLQSQKPIDFFELYLKKGPDVNADYFDKSALYRILDQIATTPKSETRNAVALLKIFYKQTKLPINQNYKSYLQPFSYLLRTNFEYLNKKYSSDYIDVEVIRFFVDNGANIESYDKTGNGLMTFALQTNQDDLIAYLTSKGINVSKTNLEGKDPMYFAVKNEKATNIKMLIANGYQLSSEKLASLELKNILNQEVLNILSDESLNYLSTYQDVLNFCAAFKTFRYKILEHNFFSKCNVPISKYPEFVGYLEKDNPNYSFIYLEKIKNLKIVYIHSFSKIKEVIAAIDTFSLANTATFKKDFYTNENNDLEQLIKSIESFDFLAQSLKENLIGQIKVQQENNKVSKINRPLFNKELESNSLPQLVKVLFKTADESQMSLNQALSVQRMMQSIKVEYGVKGLLFGTTSVEEGIEVFNQVKNPLICSNYGVINAVWYRRGVLANGSVYAHNTGFEKIHKTLIYFAAENGLIIEKCLYLGSYEDDHIQKAEEERRHQDYKMQQCLKCEIDKKKSEAPKDVKDFFGLFTTHNNGKIVMKNGEDYRWDYTEKGYEVYTGFMSSVKYDTFEKMILDLLEKCIEKYCK